VEVTGDIRRPNADCAKISTSPTHVCEPGTVMVLGDEGALYASYRP